MFIIIISLIYITFFNVLINYYIIEHYEIFFHWKNDPFLYIKKNLSTEEKSFIVLLGPCQPLADDLPDGIFPKDKTYRIDNFNELWYQRIMPDGSKLSKDWLSYSPQLNKIFYLC